MSPLRVGVVGVGHLGRHHARILAGLDGVELVAVADSRIGQAEAVATPLGARAIGDYRELLEPGAIDAVSIAAPTFLHREIAGAFLEKGIPTLVEKPLAGSPTEAEELVNLAKTNGVMLQVGHIERFNPALAALDSFRIRPRYLSAERMATYTFRSTDIGVIYDLMIHDIDVVLSFIPEPVLAVSALGISVFGGHEDIASARVWFEGGAIADFSASRASDQAVRKLKIWGSEGYASVDFAARQSKIVRPGDKLRRGELDLDGVDLSKPEAIKSHLFGKVLRVDQVQPESRDQLTMELEDFIQSVRTGFRPRVSGEDGLRAVRLADAILQAVDNHQWEGTPDGPTGPRNLPEPLGEPIVGLSGPMMWRVKPGRPEPSTPRI